MEEVKKTRRFGGLSWWRVWRHSLSQPQAVLLMAGSPCGKSPGGSVATVTYLFGENAFLTTYTVLALALLVSTILPRTAARASGSVAAIAFGAVCALFMYHTYQVTGSPFGFFPWVPLALTALLSAFAVWRA